MIQSLVAITVAFFVAGALFSFLEWRWPAQPGVRWWRRKGHATDLTYWFTSPFVTKGVTQAAIIVAVVAAALLLGAPLRPSEIKPWIEARRTWVSTWPMGVQVIGVIVLADLLGYFGHRLMHRGLLWRFHAVHHMSKSLDWLAAARAHPLNEAAMKVIQVVPLFALGFHVPVLATVTPLFTVYALGLHANVRWTFGPLRYVLASPAFHRFHHTSEERGLDKNFAGLFPVWDLLFGTFYMPRGERPSEFGVRDAVPEGYLAQLVWPFRRAGTEASPMLTAAPPQG